MSAGEKYTSQPISSEKYFSTPNLPDVGPSQVLPFLYLGSQEDALSVKAMQKNHITHVINVSITGDRVTFLDKNDDEHFLRIPIHDSLTAQLLPYFDDTYTFIEKARLNNGRVFIHCLAGISRSPALAMAYIMRYLNLSADDAYQHVKRRRPHISPNFNFLGQLSEYERNLSSQSSTTSTIIPVGKCIRIETPFQNHRRFVPVQTSGSTMSSVGHPIRVSAHPKDLDFNRIHTSNTKILLSLPSTLKSLSDDAPRQQLAISRPNSITFKCPSPKIDCSMSESTSSTASGSTDAYRVRTGLKSSDASLFKGKTDLISTLFQETNIMSKPTPLLDPSKEATRNVSSSTCQLLVS